MKQTEKEAIAAKLRTYVDSKESQNAAAKSLRGVSAATVSQILNGNWDLISDDMWRTVGNQIGYDPRNWPSFKDSVTAHWSSDSALKI